ncbi:hypothetical protein ALC53_05786 [Atta colombica]|uniref:Uncharacterized protein n=1 Tax=Atta colombica TaxID=520822 RepID=A0A195BHL3_9HYME|nr:hypothetical protein ALC53_05786 [Atta colombica]
MRLMRTYLNGNSKIKVNPISFANSFTSNCGAKAILETHKEDENFSKEIPHHPQVQPIQLPMKKRKSYFVAIVMQQSTFQGMEKEIKCVDAHVK